MAGKSLEERVTATEERIRQLEARKRALAQQLQQQERKERTRRLIQVGAIMTRLGIDTVEKALAVHKAFNDYPKAKAWLDRVTDTIPLMNNELPERS